MVKVAGDHRFSGGEGLCINNLCMMSRTKTLPVPYVFTPGHYWLDSIHPPTLPSDIHVPSHRYPNDRRELPQLPQMIPIWSNQDLRVLPHATSRRTSSAVAPVEPQAVRCHIYALYLELHGRYRHRSARRLEQTLSILP